jgi:glycosyltransferase involved in cell wall biosynthesis
MKSVDQKPNDPLKISIVTPSFNQAQFIEQTIQSVLAQNYPHLEHLVIDGGSTDGTLAILRRYEHSLKWVSEPDEGQTQAINKGFKKATGDILAWLNSDDTYLPQTLQTVATFFNLHSEIDVVYGDALITNTAGQILLRRREIPFDIGVLLWGLNYICQPTVFIRRSVIDNVGYLDETLHYGMDLEYWLRIARNGGQFAHIPQYLATARWHLEAKTLAALPEMQAELEAVCKRYQGQPKFQSPYWQKLYRVCLNKIYRLKRQALKIVLRRTIDFPPGHWVLKKEQNRPNPHHHSTPPGVK